MTKIMTQPIVIQSQYTHPVTINVTATKVSTTKLIMFHANEFGSIQHVSICEQSLIKGVDLEDDNVPIDRDASLYKLPVECIMIVASMAYSPITDDYGNSIPVYAVDELCRIVDLMHNSKVAEPYTMTLYMALPCQPDSVCCDDVAPLVIYGVPTTAVDNLSTKCDTLINVNGI